MHRVRATLATLAALAALGLAGGQDAHTTTTAYRTPVCATEDACRVDYGAQGWRIMECRGACDDRGARTMWRTLYVQKGR